VRDLSLSRQGCWGCDALLEIIVMRLIDNQSSYRWSGKIRCECVTRELSPCMIKRDISARIGLAKNLITTLYCHAKERKIPDTSCQNICSHHGHNEVNHLLTANQSHFTLHRPPPLKPNPSSPYPLPHTHSQPSHPFASEPPSQRVRYYRLHDPQWRKKAKSPQPRHAHTHQLVA
jgi:hypothetical protein